MRLQFFSMNKGKIFILALACLGLTACGSSIELIPKNKVRTAVTDDQVLGIAQETAQSDRIQQGGTLDSISLDTVTITSTEQPQATDPSLQIEDDDPLNTESPIYFDLDSYVITPSYQRIVITHADYLNANRDRGVVLEGHTDERGGREYNLALGQKRAEAVMLALRVLGVKPQQIEAVSFGEESPVAAGSNEDAWAQNRRVEFRYR